jgi:hypothetical protein
MTWMSWLCSVAKPIRHCELPLHTVPTRTWASWLRIVAELIRHCELPLQTVPTRMWVSWLCSFAKLIRLDIFPLRAMLTSVVGVLGSLLRLSSLMPPLPTVHIPHCSGTK